MKTYSVLFALDVPHYGSVALEARNDVAALRAAQRTDPATCCTDADWSEAVCRRVVHIEAPDGGIVAADVPLDDFLLRRGGAQDRRLCEAAPELLAALEVLIARADDLIAAMDGVTDEFTDEVGRLIGAVRRAECAARAAGGIPDQPDLFAPPS